MAFTTLTAGDRLLMADGMNCKPKIPKSGYTPQLGDIVMLDASNDGVDILAGTNAMYGLVYSLNSWSTNDVTRPISVIEFVSGVAITVAYTGSVTVGHKVAFSTNTHDSLLGRTVLLDDNTNGDTRSKITAKDTGTQYGTGYMVVEFI